MRDLTAFLNPRSIAVVGASPDPAKVRGMALQRLIEMGYRGRLYPVNPSHDTIMGLPAFRSVGLLPEAPDLAMLVVGSAQLCGAARECGERGIGSLVVLAGLPSGPSGATIQDELGRVTRHYSMTLLGPNALGFWNPSARVAATFAPLIESSATIDDSLPRTVSIVSQSGGVANSLYDKCHRSSIGVRYVVSTGNEADLDCLEVTDFLVSEGGSKIVILYIEGFQDPSAFAAVAGRAADRGVALVAIKVGRSAAGQRAAVSHTAHLTGSDAAYDAMFELYGVLRVDDLDEALVAAKILSAGRSLPGRRAIIVSTGGGFGALLSDACHGRGIDVPDLDAVMRERLGRVIPDYGFAGNPVDLPGGHLLEDKGVSLARILDDVGDSDSFDAIVLCFGLDGKGRIESMRPAIEPSLRRLAKPVLFHSPTLIAPDNQRALADLGVHDYSVADCARALMLLHRHHDFRQRWQQARNERSLEAIVPRAAPRTWQAADILAALTSETVATPSQVLVTTCDEAVAAAGRLGFPVALKIESPDIHHKTDVGGVRLALRSASEIEDAFGEILATVSTRAPNAAVAGVTVQKMASKGVELAVGVIRDPDFGPLVMLSSGGILIEVMQDTAFAPLPLGLDDARRLIGRLRSSVLLGPLRGSPAADSEALAQFLVAVGALFSTAAGEVEELEFNPVIVHPAGQGLSLVDVLVVAADCDQRSAAAVEARNR